MLANRMQAAAAGRRKTLEFYDDAVSTGASITIPAGAPPGAIAILAQVGTNDSSSIPSLVTPAGWTNISGLSDTFSTGGIGGRAAVAVKILDEDDEGDSITGINADHDQKVLVVFVPNFAPSAIVANDSDSQLVRNANPSADTILSGGGNVPLIAMAFGKEGFGLTPDTNNLAGASAEAGGELGIFWSIYNDGDTPQNHNFDVGNPAGADNWCASCYFEIT